MQVVDRMKPDGLVKGRIEVWRPRPKVGNGCHVYGVETILKRENQIQLEWAAIACQCIGLGNRGFRVNAMYLEFENVANPADPITPPSFERAEGREYYEDLAMSGTRDFLRVPLLVAPSIDIEPGYEEVFTEGVSGNRLTFYAQSQGTVGVHGKSFNDGVNSKVFGVALVSTPVFSDITQDLIFARNYFETADQSAKLASSQLGVTWEVVFA